MVSDVRAVANDDEALKLMQGPQFDPSQTAVLIGNPADLPERQGAKSSPTSLLVYTPEYIVIDVNAKQAGYLVLTDAYYPGWTATQDGQPTNIEQADVMFRAVKVPAGQHRVEMRYEPQSFKVGLGITLWACLVLIVGLVLVKRQRMKKRVI